MSITPIGSSNVIQSISYLKDMAKKARLLDLPLVKSSLYQLSMRWNNQLAIMLYTFLFDQLDGSAFIDSVFEIPNKGDFTGNLILGRVKDKPDILFRHDINKLPMHILAAGTSGSGKTNFAKILTEQALRSGVKTVMISDPKSEYNNIALKHY